METIQVTTDPDRTVAVAGATLARRFPAVLGDTPASYLTRRRLDLAARRLGDTDERASSRSPAPLQRLIERVEVRALPGGGGLLAGDVAVELRLADSDVRAAVVEVPPGAPARPLDEAGMRDKVADCGGPLATAIADATWDSASAVASELLAEAMRIAS